MSDETIRWGCPNCSCELGLDDTGDLYRIKPPHFPEGATPGLGTLITIEASPGWQHRRYFEGQANGGKQGAPSLVEPGVAGKQNQEQAEEVLEAYIDNKIQAAIDKDLSERHIKTNLPTEDNETN